VQYSTNGTNWSSSFTPEVGSNTVYARQVDAAGNASPASEALVFTLDTSAVAPTVALQTDTGSSTTDRITSNGALAVAGTESGATLEYSNDGSTWTNSFTPSQGSNTVYVRQIDVAGNISDASAALTFNLDNTKPSLQITSTNDSIQVGKTATLSFTFSEAVSGFSAEDIVLSNTAAGSIGSLSQASTNANGSVTYTAVFTPDSTANQLSTTVSVLGSSFADNAGNTGASNPSTTLVAGVPAPASFSLTIQNSNYKSVSLDTEVPSGYNWSNNGYQVSRFDTAAVVLNGTSPTFNSTSPNQLGIVRVIDLHTGKTLAGKELESGQFILRTNNASTEFALAKETTVDGVKKLVIQSYDYGLGVDNAKLETSFGSQVINLPALNTNENRNYHLWFPAEAPNRPSYLTGNIWTAGITSTDPGNPNNNINIPYTSRTVLWKVEESGNLTEILGAPTDWTNAGWSNGFSLNGDLWFQNNNQEIDEDSVFKYSSSTSTWTTEVGEVAEMYWDYRALANGQGSVVRQGDFAYDLREIIEPENDVITDNRANWNSQLADGSLLIRAEVYEADSAESIGHEHWILVKDGIVIADNAFNSEIGALTRALMQPNDGNVYFQQIDFSFTSDGLLQQPDSGNVATVYKISPDQLITLLESGEQNYAGKPGVTSIAGYSKQQLGGTSNSNVLTIIDGFYPLNIFTPNSTEVLVNSTVIDFDSNADDGEKSFLSRFTSSNNMPIWQTPLNGEIDEIKINADSTGSAVFLSLAYENNNAFFLNTLTGLLLSIPKSLFDEIDENGVLPSSLGNSGNNTLIGTDFDDRLYGFGGNDSLIGGNGNDWLFGGIGNDTLIGGAGDDMFFGGFDADLIELGSGKDTIILASIADSTATAMDTVVGFGADDKIDLTRLIGQAGYSFAEIKTDSSNNLLELRRPLFTLADGNEIETSFASIEVYNTSGQPINKIVLDFQFDPGEVKNVTLDRTATNWDLIALLDNVTNDASLVGGLSLAGNEIPSTTIGSTGTTGRVARIKFELSDENQTSFVFEPLNAVIGYKGSNSEAFVSPPNAKSVGVEDTLFLVVNSNALGTPGDNEIHFFQSFDQSDGTSILEMRYDTNPAVGATTLSSIIALEFDSNFTLTPNNFVLF
jgi:hypothetical protein